MTVLKIEGKRKGLNMQKKFDLYPCNFLPKNFEKKSFMCFLIKKC